MVSLIKLIAPSILIIILTEASITIVSRRNLLLSRRKRYLTFPMGSNFIITLSLIEALMQVQPRRWNILGECDVPFGLPSDTRLFKKTKRHSVDRKNFFSQLELVLTQAGLNGSTCLRRLMCEVLQQKNLKGKSLAKDLTYAIFAYPDEIQTISVNECRRGMQNCPISLLEHMISVLHYRQNN